MSCSVHVFYFNFTGKAPQLQFVHYDWWPGGKIVTKLVGALKELILTKNIGQFLLTPMGFLLPICTYLKVHSGHTKKPHPFLTCINRTPAPQFIITSAHFSWHNLNLNFWNQLIAWIHCTGVQCKLAICHYWCTHFAQSSYSAIKRGSVHCTLVL